MDQDLAVKLIMRNIQWDEDIPYEYQGFVTKYLNLIFVMGYDEGRRSNFVNTKRQHTQIYRMDQDGTKVIYNSVAEAARKNKCNKDTIFKAIKDGRKRKGYWWKPVKIPIREIL